MMDDGLSILSTHTSLNPIAMQMFSMNKYIGEHVEPFKPIDMSSDAAASKKRKAKASPKDNSEAKKSSGTQVPYRLSDPLVAVVGKSILPRPQVTQALWVYIRENNLQVGCECMLFSLAIAHQCLKISTAVLRIILESKRQARNYLRQKIKPRHGGTIKSHHVLNEPGKVRLVEFQ